MSDKIHRKRMATILRAYADKIEHGHEIDYVLRDERDYVGRDSDELEYGLQEMVDKVNVHLEDFDADEVFIWHDLGIYVPIYSPRFVNVRPACMVCYDGFEFLASVAADYVDATKEDTDSVRPILCAAHVKEIDESGSFYSYPAAVRGAYHLAKEVEK